MTNNFVFNSNYVLFINVHTIHIHTHIYILSINTFVYTTVYWILCIYINTSNDFIQQF